MNFYTVYVRTSTDLSFGSKEEHPPFDDWFDLETGAETFRNFFKDEKEKAFLFPNRRKNQHNCVLINCAVADTTAPEVYTERLIRKMGLYETSIVKSYEISMTEYLAYLRTAYRYDVINVDDDDFFRMFHLVELDSLFNRPDFEWDEEIILDEGENKTKKLLLRDVRSLFCANDMRTEIERIYAGKAIKGEGIPVHYLLQYGDSSCIQKAQRILTQALYLNGRLKSTRVLSIHIDEQTGLDSSDMEKIRGLYQMGAGGAISIDFRRGVEYDSAFAQAGRGVIESLSKIIREFRHKVVTILHVLDKDVKKVFLENLDRMTIVEICEEPSDQKHANRYLRSRAGELSINPDSNLLLQSGDGYTKDFLDTRFMDWYENKIKCKVYPQYKALNTISLDQGKMERHGSGIEELRKMVGLHEAKTTIDRILDHHKMIKILDRFEMPQQDLSLHMVFSGNPGTAKTTVARLFAQILRENGVLSRGNLIEVGRQDLVGKYVGWTAKIVKEYFRKAKGSVLFIDEAYSLVDSNNGGFGDEAINTIVQEMENNRDDMAVIFAGYSGPMEEFLSRNPGLRSRINYVIDFPDYEENDLMMILDQMAADKKLKLTEGAKQQALEYIRAARGGSDFGNGRFVRNIFEQAMVCHGSRLIHSNLDQLREEDVKQLTREDFTDLQVRDTGIKKAAIGF